MKLWIKQRRKAFVPFVLNVLGELAANSILSGAALRWSHVVLGLASVYGVHQLRNEPAPQG